MPSDDPADALSRLQLRTFDDELGRRIIETHIWAVREGLRGAAAYDLFDGYCQRLVINGTLAMKAHAGHVIASGLLRTYLGEDAGRRVHAGAVERGSVSNLLAVIWYADIRGFTPISDSTPGPIVIDLLNDVFEILTAALRLRGGQVLKFLGDGMLATFSFEEADRAATCRRALDAAIEAMQKLDAQNAARAAAGVPVASVDLALHLGEVLYGNVGATDRLDFTVIGPAINEVARIEALCEPLGRAVLASAEFVAAVTDGDSRLEPLGRQPCAASGSRRRFSLST